MDQRPKSELGVLRDYLGAVLAVRKARTVFLLIVVLSLLTHIGAYAVVRWGPTVEQGYQQLEVARMLESTTLPVPGAPATTASAQRPTGSAKPPSRVEVSSRSGQAAPSTETRPKGVTILVERSRPTTSPSETGRADLPPGLPVAVEQLTRQVPPAVPPFRMYQESVIAAVLPLARFAGLAATGLLIMTQLIGVNICLAGRMGGVCHATSAFFWSIVLAALVFPWRNLMPVSMIDLPDAFFDLEQLRTGLGNLPIDSTLEYVLHYGRFLGVQVLAILAALVSGIRLSLAYRQVRMAVEPLIQMKVV